MRQPVYTVAEVAKLYKWSRSTIYKHIEDGLLPCLKPGENRGSIRIRESDLQEYERRLSQGHDISDPDTGSPAEESQVGESAGRIVDWRDPFELGREISRRQRSS